MIIDISKPNNIFEFLLMRFFQYPEHWILIGVLSVISTWFFILFIFNRKPWQVFAAFAIIMINIFLILYFVMIENLAVQPMFK